MSIYGFSPTPPKRKRRSDLGTIADLFKLLFNRLGNLERSITDDEEQALIEASQQIDTILRSYDPDQERDEDGKWTDEGGGGGDRGGEEAQTGFKKLPPEGDADPNNVLTSSQNVTHEQRKAVFQYQAAAYRNINRHLTGRELITTEGHPSLEKVQTYIRDLDTLMSNSTVTEDVTVHRGSQRFDSHNWENRIGEETEFKSFTSTSLRSDIGKSFADENGTRYEIKVPKGTNAVYVNSVLGEDSGSVGTERELILPRGSRFKVTGVVVSERLVKLELLQPLPNKSKVKALLTKVNRLIAYDPDQDRDEDGKWTDEGGGSGGDKDKGSSSSDISKHDFTQKLASGSDDKLDIASADAVTPQMKEGVQLYQESIFRQVNPLLRGQPVPNYGGGANTGRLEVIIGQVDSAMELSTIKQDLIVHRGSIGDIGTIDEWEEKIGQEVSSKAYTSTSLSKEVAEKYSRRRLSEVKPWQDPSKPYAPPPAPTKEAVQYEIKVAAGKNGLYMNNLLKGDSEFPEEWELLLPRNSTFKVNAVNKRTKTVSLELM